MKFLSLPSGKIINIEHISFMEPQGDGEWWIHFKGMDHPKGFNQADAKVIQGKIFQ